MKSFRFASLFSLSGILSAVGFAFSRATESVLEVAAFLVDIVVSAFPPRELPLFAFGVATAPRVLGRVETRAFHQRRAERWPDQRSRPALSAAFVAT